MYSLYFITFQRPRTRPVTKPLRSIRPEHRGPYTIVTHSLYGYEGRRMVILWWLLFAPPHPKSTIFAWEEDRPAGMTDAWLLIVLTPCATGWPSWSLTTRKTFKLNYLTINMHFQELDFKTSRCSKSFHVRPCDHAETDIDWLDVNPHIWALNGANYTVASLSAGQSKICVDKARMVQLISVNFN